jgi:hypothetical protein
LPSAKNGHHWELPEQSSHAVQVQGAVKHA